MHLCIHQQNEVNFMTSFLQSGKYIDIYTAVRILYHSKWSELWNNLISYYPCILRVVLTLNNGGQHWTVQNEHIYYNKRMPLPPSKHKYMYLH